jgi:hypothetical protein
MLRDLEPETPEEQKIADAEKTLNDAMNGYDMALTESWEAKGQTPAEASMFASRQIMSAAVNHTAVAFLSIARLSGDRLDVAVTRHEIMRIIRLVLDQVGDRVEEELPELIEVILAADN